MLQEELVELVELAEFVALEIVNYARTADPEKGVILVGRKTC